MKKPFVILIVVLVLLGAGVFLNATRSSKLNSNNTKVVVTIYPLYDFTKNIAGDKIELSGLISPGVEPHDFEPTLEDIKKINQSKLIIYNGSIDNWIEKLQIDKNPSPTKLKIINSVEENQKIYLVNKEIDPHIWLDPVLALNITDAITTNLIDIDPINRDFYLGSASQYKNKLKALDQDYKEGLKNCKEQEILTDHSAFNYLAKRYNFKMRTIGSGQVESELTNNEIATVINSIKANNTKYILTESDSESKTVQTISQETQIKNLVLSPIENPGKLGKDYISQMNKNLVSLKTALECS